MKIQDSYQKEMQSRDEITRKYNLPNKPNYLSGELGETEEHYIGRMYSKWCEAKESGPKYL